MITNTVKHAHQIGKQDNSIQFNIILFANKCYIVNIIHKYRSTKSVENTNAYFHCGPGPDDIIQNTQTTNKLTKTITSNKYHINTIRLTSNR